MNSTPEKDFVVTYTVILNDRFVRRQKAVRAADREHALGIARHQLSEAGDPFKLVSCKEWTLDNITKNENQHTMLDEAKAKKK